LTTPESGTSRPGIRVGSASEFSLFFRVRPGHERELREAVEALLNAPGYRPGDYQMPVEELALVPFSFPTYANALGRAAILTAIELDHTGRWAVDHLETAVEAGVA